MLHNSRIILDDVNIIASCIKIFIGSPFHVGSSQERVERNQPGADKDAAVDRQYATSSVQRCDALARSWQLDTQPKVALVLCLPHLNNVSIHN